MNESLQIYLNSKDAISYIDNKTSNCIFSLPNIPFPRYKRQYISLVHAEIPNSFLNIDDVNNTLIYEVNSGGDIELTIDEGNYNANTLKTYLNSNMSGFSITYDNVSNKYTFTHDTDDFVIKSTSTCLEVIGFSDSSNHSSTSLVLTSDNVVNFYTIRNILVMSPNFVINNISSFDTANKSIISNIPVSHGSFSIIQYSNFNNFRNYLDEIHNLNNLHIILLDQNGKVLDLNGCHYSLNLQIDFV